MTSPLLTLLFFILGLIFGSFYNVVGLRVPVNKPFANDRSVCPNCGHQLTWYENIPVLSYLFLKGKCKHCGTKISPIYPVTELATGMLFAGSYLYTGLHLELVTALLFVSMLMIIFVSDIRYMVIPDKVLLFFLPLLAIMRIIVPLDPWYNALIGMITGFGIIFVIILLSNGGMGAGDMKLFAVIGIVLGWELTLMTLFFASVIGTLISLPLLIGKKVQRKQAVPFGPYIVAGALISYFYGVRLWMAYMGLY